MSAMFSGLSMLIWSLIAAKAKTGMSAATNGEFKSVSAGLKHAGTLILMIVVASGINVYMQMDNLEQAAAPSFDALMETASAGRQLRATKQLHDSHYKGGVAAAAFDQFKTMSMSDFVVNKKATTAKKQVPAAQRGRTTKTPGVPKIG